MKISFLPAIILSLVIFDCNAQISPGSIFLGGQINFSTQKTSSPIGNITGTSSNDFNFSPAIGKAIRENMIVGIDLNYGHVENKQPAISEVDNNNLYGAGVFLRRYVPLGKGFYIFGQGRFGASYSSGNTTESEFAVVTTESKGFSFDLGFYPGVSYQVNKRLQLETGFNNLFLIDYTHTKTTQTNPAPPTESNTSSFSIGTSLNNLTSFTLGIRVLLSH